MKKFLLFLSPLIILIEILLFSNTVILLRQPSDVAVLVGVLMFCVLIVINYYLIKIIIKQIK